GLVEIFDSSARNGSLGNQHYYRPYNAMLAYCFGENFDFVVLLWVSPTDMFGEADDRKATGFVQLVVFVDVDQRPVLFLDLKDDSHVGFPAKRKAADVRMRKRYNDLLYDCPIPKLHGLSVLGTHMRVYCRDKADGIVRPSSVP
ncbi:hypothetical protein DFH08DRAFT_660186, partial [Mycena albidolilacea]